MWDAPVGPGPEYCTRNARHVITSEIRSTFGVIYEPFGGGSRGRWREGKSNGGVWETNSWCWFRASRSPRAIPPRHLARLRPIPWRRGGTWAGGLVVVGTHRHIPTDSYTPSLISCSRYESFVYFRSCDLHRCSCALIRHI